MVGTVSTNRTRGWAGRRLPLARVSAVRSRLLNGPAPVLVLVVAAALAGALCGGLKDLLVYQYGGRMALEGLPLLQSRDPVTGLRFTYPPFAAVVMVPLALLPAWLAAALWTGASVGALSVVVVVVRRALDRPAPGWLVALVTGGALALEPVWQNLTFGQINLFLMAAVLVDLVRPERRWAGVLVGIAAGVKLTPLVFVVLLVLVGRRTAAGRAVLTFGGTVAVGFAATPGSAATYWADGLVDPGRVGPPALAHNQSAYGALTRLLDGEPPTLLWLAIAGPLSLAVLAVGAGWWRRGDRVPGTCLGALAMLLASPIAWSHHWVWAVPIALALWERTRCAAAAWTAVFVARPIVWPPWGKGREYGWSPPDHLVGNAYLLAAVALAVWAAATLNRRGGSSTRRTNSGMDRATATRALPLTSAHDQALVTLGQEPVRPPAAPARGHAEYAFEVRFALAGFASAETGSGLDGTRAPPRPHTLSAADPHGRIALQRSRYADYLFPCASDSLRWGRRVGPM